MGESVYTCIAVRKRILPVNSHEEKTKELEFTGDICYSRWKEESMEITAVINFVTRHSIHSSCLFSYERVTKDEDNLKSRATRKMKNVSPRLSWR